MALHCRPGDSQAPFMDDLGARRQPGLMRAADDHLWVRRSWGQDPGIPHP